MGKKAGHSPRSRSKGFYSKTAIAEAIANRGRSPYNIWYGYSPKSDSDVILLSDVELSHLFSAEGDPDISWVKYGAPEGIVALADGDRKTTFDAQRRLRSGRDQLVEVKSTRHSQREEATRTELQMQAQKRMAEALDADYIRFDPGHALANSIRIQNWKVGVATISAARLHSVALQNAALNDLLRMRGCWTAADMLQAIPSSEHALFLAAFFKAVSQGRVYSDLDSKPWGLRTKVWREGADLEPEGAEAHHSTEESPHNNAAAAQSDADRSNSGSSSSEPWSSRLSYQAEEPTLTRYTRKSLPLEYRDYGKWPTADDMALDPAKAALDQRPHAVRFRSLRAALIGYLSGAKLDSLEVEFDINRSEIYCQLNRAVMLHHDGRIFGWRALIAGTRTGDYFRSAPVTLTEDGKYGFAGAFGLLMRDFPDIRKALDALILREPWAGEFQEARISAEDVHTELLKMCRRQGLSNNDYPFVAESQARETVRTYTRKLRAQHLPTGANLYGGRGAMQRSKLGNGHEPLLSITRPYDAVFQDGHKLDLIGTVRIPHPSGSTRVPIQRFIFQPVVEGKSSCTLGYSLTIGGEASGSDALEAVSNSLSKWERCSTPRPIVEYQPGGGLPSGVIPELEGAAWATHYLDNASINTSAAMLERMRRRVGCFINLGGVGDWARRHVVEAVFSVLEKRGFQRLPNTTGSHPKDPRRRDAEAAALEMECDYEEVKYLVDVAVANLNGTPLESLGYRSPLQALADDLHDPRVSFVPRGLPPLPPSEPDLHIVREARVFRGNVKEGRAVYVEIDRVPYTNPVISKCGNLIGTRIWVHIDTRDMRTVKALYFDGGELGCLIAGEGWNATPHDRTIRKGINRLRDAKQIARKMGEDWPQAYLRHLSEKAMKSLPKNGKKVSKHATAVAKTAARTGLSVPEVPRTPITPPTFSASSDQALPPFVAKPSRTALY